jgi:hypothetical protein
MLLGYMGGAMASWKFLVPTIIAIIILIGGGSYLYLVHPNVTTTTTSIMPTVSTTTTIQNSSKIVPNPFSSSACTAITWYITGHAINATGFNNITRTPLGIEDYLLPPSHSGSIIYSYNYSYLSEDSNKASINFTNNLVFSNINASSNTKNPGLEYTFNPATANLLAGKPFNFTLTLTALPNATDGTYWLWFGPSGNGCSGGGVIILTIGTTPYTGNIPLFASG